MCSQWLEPMYSVSQKKTEPAKISYVFAEIITHNNVIIIHNSLMNLTFLCLWDFILFVQYKSKQNKLKVLSHTDLVFNAYIIREFAYIMRDHRHQISVNW